MTSSMVFGRKVFAVLLVIIIVITIGLVVFLKLSAKSADGISSSKAIVEPAAPSYIGNSSIYLLSANSSYGTYDETSVFMVNVTVRNDYTSIEPPPSTLIPVNSTGEAYFILLANLYDKNGTQISSQEYIPPQDHPDYNEVSLSSGETTSLTIYMTASNRNIVRYNLIFGFLGDTPPP